MTQLATRNGLSEGKKRCTKCKQIKAFSDFNRRSKGGLMGLHARCRACQKEYFIRHRDATKPAILAKDGLKLCAACDEVKPVEDFYQGNNYRSGYSPSCKACTKASTIEASTLASDQRCADIETTGQKKCALCRKMLPLENFHLNNKSRDGYQSYCRDCRRTTDGSHFKRLYGISEDQYMEMFISQMGRCAICGEEETSFNRHGEIRRLCVDHDHTTGKVRALLCTACNSALGYLREDKSRVKALLAYLENWSEK